MAEFAKLTVLEELGWTLYVHQDQCYLGRAYVWLKRPGEMQRLSGLEPQEEYGLSKIIAEYEAAVATLWAPDHMNYAWLGNDFEAHAGHGHMHLIPRYKRPVEFAGMTFIDERWGKNYVPCEKRECADELLFRIRDLIRKEIFARRQAVFASLSLRIPRG